jgi:hypothetical protein
MTTLEERYEALKKENHKLRNMLQHVALQLELARVNLEQSAKPFNDACMTIKNLIAEVYEQQEKS